LWGVTLRVARLGRHSQLEKLDIAALNGAAERFVENGDAHVEEGLHGPSVPSHLLLFYHALREDLVDRAFGRNRQPVMAPPTIVH